MQSSRTPPRKIRAGPIARPRATRWRAPIATLLPVLLAAPRVVPVVALCAVISIAAGFAPPQAGREVGELATGPAPYDVFHPAMRPGPDGVRPPQPKPAYGGRAIVHLESMPTGLCGTLGNNALVRRIMYELHETLLLQDWETMELVPNVCSKVDVEDTLVLKPAEPDAPRRIAYGVVTDAGDAYRVAPGSPNNLAKERVVPKSDVASLEQRTVFTFHLRPGVKWHDGHPFDANDVYFSWAIYKNPSLDCGSKRYQFLKIVDAEVLDPLTIRFFYGTQYFRALDSIGDMFLLPSHLYDLSDPDNARYDPAYRSERLARDPNWKPSEKEQGAYVNDNPRNRAWVGLGPYKVVEMTSDHVDAARFDDYFDEKRAGYLDAIRWRTVQNDAVAMQAVLNGELDFFARMTSEDYFGELSQKPAFTDRCYKGHFYAATFWYCAWNLLRPKFQDLRVRRALASAFDFDAFKKTYYLGAAIQVTGGQSIYAQGYDRTVKPYPFDLEAAKKLLAEAGWYDRDQDGVVDKDGEPLEIEFLSQAGNKVTEAFLREYQASLARIGVRGKSVVVDNATLSERQAAREFDAIPLGWVPPPESDPEQAWSSRSGAAGERSTNLTGFQDPEVDALIARGQRELDRDKRSAIWREIHRRVYEAQPMLFGFNPPRKYAMNKKLFGFQAVPIDPNYVLRRWYYPEGTPGTRAERERPREAGGN